MSKSLAVLLLSLSGITIAAAEGNFWSDWGGHLDHHFSAPEIDPSSAISALTLLVGGIAVLRGRISKK